MGLAAPSFPSLATESFATGCLDRTAFQGLLCRLSFRFRFRLMENYTETGFVVVSKDCRCCLSAHIAIDALIGDIEGAGNIFREP
jgi:hypothetical protein